MKKILKDNIIIFEYTILIMITCFGFFLRFYRLGEWSLWNDETHTIQVALGGILKDEVGKSIFYPLNFLITKLSFLIFGINEFSARFFPSIFGIITIPITYLLAKYTFGRSAAILASLFLSLYTWHIDWSQNARYYTLECFLVVVSSYLFFKGLEQNRFRYILFSFLTIILAILSHPSATFIIAAYIFYLFINFLFKIEKPIDFKKNSLLFICPFLFISFAALPWYKNLVLLLLKERRVVSSPFYILQNVSYHVTIPFLSIAIAIGLYLILNKDRKGIFFISCIMVPLVLLILASKITLAYGAYIFYTLPFYCILVAYGCAQLFNYLKGNIRALAYGICLALVLVLVSNNYLYFIYENGNRARWKDASFYVGKNIKYGDVVFASDGGTVQFYLKNIPDVYWLGKYQDISEELNKKRIWFLIHNDDENRLQGNFLNLLHTKCKFMNEFFMNSSIKNRTIKVYLYTPDATY